MRFVALIGVEKYISTSAGKLRGKIPVGRPRCRRGYSIETVLREMFECEGMDLSQLIQNRIE